MEQFVGTLRKLELADYDDNLKLVKKNDSQSYREVWGSARWTINMSNPNSPDSFGEILDPDGADLSAFS
jgi:hypothetical protein